MSAKLGALRLIYTGSNDVESDTRFHTTELGGELRFYLNRFGAHVASVRHPNSPDILFASHLKSGDTIFLHESEALDELKDIKGAQVVETPIGLAVLFESATDNRFGGIDIKRVDYMETSWRTPGHEGAIWPDWWPEEKPQ